MTSFTHDSAHLAQTYDRVSDLQLEGGKRLVERLAIEEGARVLDIGCGTGRLTRWIAERVGPKGSAVGIDPLEERIAIARTQSTAHFELGQAEDLSAFEDASFDAVCMSAVFHWVADKPKALTEIRRVLRPGGRLGLTTSPQELSRAGTVAHVLQPLLRRAPYAGHVDLSSLTTGQRCTSTDLITLVLESGLDLVELHVTQRPSRHENGEAFLQFVEASAFGNFLRIVPENLRAPFRADLVAALDAQTTAEGLIVRGWGLLAVTAKA
jgi:ubiquinone/menaquinone biosynthesis C-methylase UbiE